MSWASVFVCRKKAQKAQKVLASLEGDKRTFRVYAPDHVLSPNSAAAFRLNDVRYNEALKYGRYARMIAKAFRYPDATNIFPTECGARPPVPVTALERLGVRVIDRCEYNSINEDGLEILDKRSEQNEFIEELDLRRTCR